MASLTKTIDNLDTEKKSLELRCERLPLQLVDVMKKLSEQENELSKIYDGMETLTQIMEYGEASVACNAKWFCTFILRELHHQFGKC